MKHLTELTPVTFLIGRPIEIPPTGSERKPELNILQIAYEEETYHVPAVSITLTSKDQITKLRDHCNLLLTPVKLEV